MFLRVRRHACEQDQEAEERFHTERFHTERFHTEKFHTERFHTERFHTERFHTEITEYTELQERISTGYTGITGRKRL
jgi:hypothetical protein